MNTVTNTGLAKVAVQCSADTFVVNQSLALHINICASISPPSQSPKTLAVIINRNGEFKNLIQQKKIKNG